MHRATCYCYCSLLTPRYASSKRITGAVYRTGTSRLFDDGQFPAPLTARSADKHVGRFGGHHPSPSSMDEDRGPPATPGRLYRKRDRNLSPTPSSNVSVASFSSEAECGTGRWVERTCQQQGRRGRRLLPRRPEEKSTGLDQQRRHSSLQGITTGCQEHGSPAYRAVLADRQSKRNELNAHFDVIAPRQVKAIRVNGRKNVIAVDVHMKEAVPKLLLVKKLGGIPVEARVPWTRHHIAGVVRDVDQGLSEEDIYNSMRAPAHIPGVRRLGKSTTVRVTFEGKGLPQYVHMGYVRHPCFRCNRMGHIAAVCERERTCEKCSGNHETSTCESETARCVNCRRDHAATSSECPVLRKERKVCKQRARSASTHTEARAAVRKQNTDKAASRRGAPPTTASGAQSSKGRARLPEDDFPPLVARRTGAKEVAGHKDVTRSEPTESKRARQPEGTAQVERRQSFAHVTRDVRHKTPSTGEATDAALLRMVSRLFRAVRQLAQAWRHTPEAKFALEVLDADVPTVLQWNYHELTARYSELTLHLQRSPSPVLALVKAGLPGKRALPGVSIGKRTFHVLVGYVRPDGTEWPTDDLLTWCKNIDGDLLLCDALNAHSEAWDSRKMDKRTDAVTKLLEELDLVVASDGGPTVFRPPSTYSAIDVTAHAPTLELAWATAPDTRGSDHFPIHITVKGCQMVRKVVRSCTNWDVFRAALDTSRAYIATAIVQALQEATHTTCISEWLPNPDLTFLNLQAARTRAQRKYRRTKNPEDKTQFNRVPAKLRRHAKALVRARWKLMCRNINAHLSQPKLWRVLGAMTGSCRTRHALQVLALAANITEQLAAERFCALYAPAEAPGKPGTPNLSPGPLDAPFTVQELEKVGLESLERQSWERSLFQLARLSTTHPGRWFLRRIRGRTTASWSKVVEVFFRVAAPLTMPQRVSRARPWDVPKIASEVRIKYLRSKQDKPPLVIKELVEAHLELVAVEKALLEAAKLPPQPMVLLTDSRCAIQKIANAETGDPATAAARKALAILEAHGSSAALDVRWHLLQEKPEKSLPKGTLTGLSRAEETIHHILCVCPAYEIQRQVLRQRVKEGTQMTTDDLLFPDGPRRKCLRIFKALLAFLRHIELIEQL
ncbi:hypothetical protein HPB47_028192 [Ixodes persulcatus]|uniref:Uncharacterized protein n=1 Tax=Ixodes persulcatus TaxID=34615 RepID=A0AC60PVN5_IXOPE|nr:hypothetical protein HPB47_028192 [Ixodes persulcatus]